MNITDAMKNKKAIELLYTHCERIGDIYQRLLDEESVDSKEFSMILITLVGAGYPEAAKSIVDTFSPEEDKESYYVDIQMYMDEGYKPCGCIKLDCTEDEIKACQGKLTFNNGQGEDKKINNTCAYFIKTRKVTDACKVDEATESIDSILDVVIDGNRAALMEKETIDALSILNQMDNSKYQKFIEELKAAKIPIGELKKEVEKNTKQKAREDSQNEKGMLPATVEEVNELIRPYYENIKDSSCDWLSKEGYIYTQDGDKTYEVSNFFPLITEKLTVDDGREKEVYFNVTPICDMTEVLSSLIIPAKDFKTSSWVFQRVSNKAILFRNRYYESIRRLAQLASKDAPDHKVTGCIGWLNTSKNEAEPDYSYCYSGGSIGETKEPVRVIEMNELNGYKFVAESPKLIDCYEAYKNLESLIPDRKEVMLTLIAHSFSSILVHKLEQEGMMPKHLVWLYGCSGSFKTSVALVVLSMFGAMENPPCTFNDTVNSIEKKMHLAKDALLLIDDFFPASTPTEANQKNSKASIVTRGIGDRIGKARAGSNMVLRSEYRPRGNALVTGEDCPTGFSTTSRHLSIALNRGDVDVDKLTTLQNSSHLLNGLLIHFILYVKHEIMDNPDCLLKPLIVEIRDKAQNSNHHKRFAMSIAHLQSAYETLIQFFVFNELLTAEEAKVKCEESLEIFMQVAEEQNRLMQNEDVADKFMTALGEMISTRTIEPKNVDLPRTILSSNNVCYDDDDNYYFVPSSTYSEVVRFYQLKNEPLMMTERMLWKMLDDKGYLLRQKSADSDKHVEYKIRKTIGEKSIRVIGVKKSLLDTF